MQALRLTVAICTYNRADCLEEAVRSSFEQETSCAYDVLVVDNNSTDGTPALLASLKQRYPALRHVTEEQQGLSHARNRALQESQAEIIAYVDDDCILSRGWVEAISRGFDDSQVALVGGLTNISYPNGDRPKWVTSIMEGLLGLNDRGPTKMDVEEVFGNNMAVWREHAMSLGGYGAGFGYSGSSNDIAGEDTEFCHRAREAGFRIVYLPDAVLVHRVHQNRLKLEWFFRRSRENGRHWGIVRRKQLNVWKAANNYVRSLMLRGLLRYARDRRRPLASAMEVQFLGGQLDIMLPGIFGTVARIALVIAAVPFAAPRAIKSAIWPRKPGA